MNRATVSLTSLALAGVLAVAPYAGPATATPLPAPTSATFSDGARTTQQVAVSIRDFAFSPTPITVAAGTTVTWTNEDSAAHTVTFDDASVPSSEVLARGATFSITFATAGTYTYYCSIHPSMRGTVTVT